MHSHRLAIATLASLLVHVACMFASDDDWKFDTSLKPSLLQGSRNNVTAPAVKYSAGMRYNAGLNPDDDLALSLESKGVLATDSRANSENLFAALHLGYSHLFADWEMVATTNRTSDGPSGRPVFKKVDKFGGLFDLFVKTRFETDQSFENYNVTYGPHLGFSPLHRRGITWLIPAAYVDYQRVEILHSKRYRDLGISEDAFWRFGASAGWRLPFGDEFLQDFRYLRPLEAEFDLHYYRAFELPGKAKAAHLDAGLFYSGTLHYNLRAINPGTDKFPWWKPYAVYVTVGHGKLPPVARDQTTVYVGVVYSWSK